MAKGSTTDVRRLLESERGRVLAQLDALSRKAAAAQAKELARQRKLRTRTAALLVEGKELGMSVTDMARAAGVTRQMAHHWLRDGRI